VRLSAHPTPEWFGAMGALQNHTIEQNRIYRRIVGALAIPAASRRLRRWRIRQRLAFGALHNGLLCYESVITDPLRQRRGYARRVSPPWRLGQG